MIFDFVYESRFRDNFSETHFLCTKNRPQYTVGTK